jgi:antitoxin VapB
MPTAKIFMSGNSQAVRLPKEFRFNVDQVDIVRRGREVVLTERPRDMKAVLSLIQQLPDKMMSRAEKLRDTPPQKRRRA